jgi:hypothetical protein
MQNRQQKNHAAGTKMPERKRLAQTIAATHQLPQASLLPRTAGQKRTRSRIQTAIGTGLMNCHHRQIVLAIRLKTPATFRHF